MKNLVIVLLAILLLTGTDIRPVFVQMLRAMSYAAEYNQSTAPHSKRQVVDDTVLMSEEPEPTPIKLPFLESPTASTVEHLSLDDALQEAEQVQIGRASKKN